MADLQMLGPLVSTRGFGRLALAISSRALNAPRGAGCAVNDVRFVLVGTVYINENDCARDRTRYSKARSGTKSFLTHHLRRVSKAAVVHDAMAIRKQITCLKQQAFGCVAYAAGAGEVEA